MFLSSSFTLNSLQKSHDELVLTKFEESVHTKCTEVIQRQIHK